MKRNLAFLLLAGVFAFASAESFAGGKSAMQSMSEEEMIKTARSAAPSHISGNATVMIPGPDGKMKVAVKGTNPFTCIPDISGQEKADPFCGDKAATMWILSAINKDAKPANTEPGFGYMGKGGFHWEKDGKIVMMDTPGAMRTKEPPHWMILWPVNPEESGLPTHPGRFGTYIMYEGTPYSHLMIYENPAKMKMGRK